MNAIRTLLVPVLFCCSAAVSAQDSSQPKATSEPLLREAIEAAPGQTLTVGKLTVEPGYSAASHSHPGETFVYVLEGRILNQIGDEEPKTYEAGQYFFEHANATHAQFVNPDKEKAAVVLIYGIRPADAR
jgi:quercetin dioxygenase-like cupin family protein